MEQAGAVREAGSVQPSVKRIPTFLAPGARFAGAVDYVAAGAGIRGWLVELAGGPTRPVIEAKCQDVVVARAYAMMDRPDIDRVADRRTQCGFLIGWSWFDVKALTRISREAPDAPIEFFVEATGEAVSVVCEMPGAAGLLGLVLAAPLGDRQPRFREVSDFREILESGLFDEAWYRAQLGAALDPGMPGILHYIREGEAAGRAPNFYFNPAAYAQEWELPEAEGALLHYIRAGGAARLVSRHFDDRWYRRRYELARHEHPLAHYLAHRPAHAPNSFFDPAYYARVSGVRDVPDLYEHFVKVGFPAGLLPSERFVSSGGRPANLTPSAALYFEALRDELGMRDEAEASGAPDAPAEPPASEVPISEPAKVEQPEKPAAAAPKGASAPAETSPVEAAPAPAKAAPPAIATPKRKTKPASVAEPADGLIPAARLGYEEARARLEPLSAAELAQQVALAEQRLAVMPEGEPDAALTLAIARHIQGDGEAAARAAAVFISAAGDLDPAIAEPTVERLLQINHRLYEQRRGEAPDAVYRAAFQRGRRDYLLTLRLIEGALDRQDLGRAAPYVAEFEARFGTALDVWAAVALSRYHQANNDVAQATHLLASVPPFPATEAFAEATLLHRLIEIGALEEAAARSEISAEDPSVELFGARFRLAVRQADAPALLAALADPRAAQLRGWQLAEAMFQISASNNMAPVAQEPVLRALNKVLEKRGVDDRAIVNARIHYLLHGKRWAELGALFERIEGSELSRERETLLRRLEYLCHVDDAEAAERIYREHFRDTALNKWEGLTVMRLLSELKRWEEAAAALLAHVGRGYGFGGAGHMGMRIVRKAGIHEALLASVAEASEHEPDLESFIARVREDHAIVQTARALSASREGGRRGRRYRSNWILDASAEEEEDEHCVFLCTNQRYFLSMLTFLCSFLGQAPQASGRIFAFLDRDVPRHWHGAVAMVAARFGRSVELVSEPEFVPEAVEHRVEYGFFAGGSNLSRAAYFRLYAARWLLANHRFSRAAYIDTDTICRADLSGLFTLDLGDKLVAAAVEDYSPDVVNAAARNNLDPTAYFNSGVLLFRFDHPEMPAHIEEAIRISEQESERLVFHDQCALNIAFQGRTAPLPSRYNFYLRPSRERNGYIEDGAILHFLDKPKPWDIIFDRSYREEWRVWALMLGSILPQALYVDIFAQANRD